MAGNVDLTNLQFTDTQISSLGVNSTLAALAVGAMHSFEYTVEWAAGQQTNTVNVTAQWSSSGSSGSVTDEDPANYLGAAPAVILDKKTLNGTNMGDGIIAINGRNVPWCVGVSQLIKQYQACIYSMCGLR